MAPRAIVVRPRRRRSSLAPRSAAAASSEGIYDPSVADAAKAPGRRRREAEGRRGADPDAAPAGRRAAEATTQDRDSKLSDLSTSSHNLQAQLDEATAINQQLRGELERLGKDVDKVLADAGTLSKALDDAKARLEELRKAQAAAEARAQLFRTSGALQGADRRRGSSASRCAAGNRWS